MPTAATQFNNAAQEQATAHLIRVVRWVRMLTHIAQGLLMVWVIFPRVRGATRAWFVQSWSRKLLRILNISLRVRQNWPVGEARKLIVVANHLSWLDIFVINSARPARFVAKSEIRDWPIVGWLCEHSGTIFIRRTKRSDTARINREIHDALAVGDTIGLFPEGTTTSGNRILKFHTSLFEPAVANGATLAPAAIRYLDASGMQCSAPVYIGETTFAESMARVIGQKAMIAEISFAPLIAAEGQLRRDLALQAELAVARLLDVPAPHAQDRFVAH